MSKRLGPEAMIISLFTALPEDSKRIVLEIIRSQTTRPKSTAVPSAPKKSKDKKVSTEGETGNATGADVCAVPKCGLPESADIHNFNLSPSEGFHKFHAAIKTKGAGAA